MEVKIKPSHYIIEIRLSSNLDININTFYVTYISGNNVAGFGKLANGDIDVNDSISVFESEYLWLGSVNKDTVGRFYVYNENQEKAALIALSLFKQSYTKHFNKEEDFAFRVFRFNDSGEDCFIAEHLPTVHAIADRLKELHESFLDKISHLNMISTVIDSKIHSIKQENGIQ